MVAERTQELASANDRLRAEIGAREQAQAELLQAQKMEAMGQLTGGGCTRLQQSADRRIRLAGAAGTTHI
jgi:C4-dicarboxylate-specific signal transduction histidine kinase